MSDGEILITASGHKKLQEELEEIYTVTKPQVVDRVREARLMGDLRENADYHDAKHVRAMLEARILQLKHILGTARIIEDGGAGDGRISVGATVRVLDLEMNEEEEFGVVGATEADPLDGKISHESALGNALLGQEVGAEVEIAVPAGTLRYRIVSVEFPTCE